MAAGQELRSFSGHTAVVKRVVFSPDGKRAVTASDDSTARVWDVASGQELLRFTGHAGPVTTVAFAPDGTTGAEVRRLTTKAANISDVSFSPDGTHFLIGTGESTASIWPTDYHDTVRYLCGVLTRDLTPDERAHYGTLRHHHRRRSAIKKLIGDAVILFGSRRV